MEVIPVFIGVIFGLLIMCYGIFYLIENNNYVKKEAIIKDARCIIEGQEGNDFLFYCQIQIMYIVGNYKYYNSIIKRTKLVPYRRFDKVNIYYNKENPNEISITSEKSFLWGLIPLLLGIILIVGCLSFFYF
jgi:hypothetical protein